MREELLTQVQMNAQGVCFGTYAMLIHNLVNWLNILTPFVLTFLIHTESYISFETKHIYKISIAVQVISLNASLSFGYNVSPYSISQKVPRN